jgi:Flp pilus assembly protein TadG
LALHRITHRLRAESGAAMVEFALVLPVVLLLMLGIMDFGRALNYWNDANQLSADGARFAAVDRNPGSAAGQTLQQYILSQGDTTQLRNNATVRVCFPSGGTPAVGDPVKVKVQMPYTFFGFLGLGQITMTGASTMRLEHTNTTYADTGSGTC